MDEIGRSDTALANIGNRRPDRAWQSRLCRSNRTMRPQKEINMHAVVRSYSGAGARQLFDILEANKDEIHSTLQKVKGMVSYTLFRQGDGGMSVTVCDDKEGTDESLQVARDWISKNASKATASPPQVTEGTVIVQII
jgi:hypothetical protein